MERHPAVGAGTPPLVYPDLRPQPCGGYFPSLANVFFRFVPLHLALPACLRSRLRLMAIVPENVPPSGADLDYATGAAFFARRDAVIGVSGFDERYFMYFEETDLCHRMHAAGWRIAAFPADPTMHVGGGSFRSGFDLRREKLFADGLRRFVRMRYRGAYRFLLMAEIAILAPVGSFLRRLFRRQ
jgi:GT2 family glycosyltransferase